MVECEYTTSDSRYVQLACFLSSKATLRAAENVLQMHQMREEKVLQVNDSRT